MGMRRTWSMLAIAGLLGWGTARAQAGASGAAAVPGNAGGAGAVAGRTANANGSRTAVQAVVRGAVQGLDITQGMIQVREPGGNAVIIHGTPIQFRGLVVGRVVALPVSRYGSGELWVQPRGGAAGLAGPYDETGRVTGGVERVDRANGLITVRGQTFRAHPVMTQNLIPGEFVTLTYGQVGNVDWISSIRPARGTGAGGAGAAPGAGGAGAVRGVGGIGPSGTEAGTGSSFGGGAAGAGATGAGATMP